MHSYKVLTTTEEIHKYLIPVLKANGFEIPQDGCFIAAVEFDEAGEVSAYQMLQNALFLEGMWARDKSAHLRTLHNMVAKYAIEKLHAKTLMTLTRQDEQGQRIGKLAEALGYKQMPWNIYRKAQPCH